MIEYETSLKIYFVLLAAEAAQNFTNRKQLHYEFIKHTQNLMFWNAGNKDGRFSVLSLC